MESADLIKNALTIDIPSAEHLKLDDCRRLTGPGLLWNHPGAVLDVLFFGMNPDKVSQVWHREARRVLDAINWQQQHIIDRCFDGGINLAISAPMDQLYSAIFAAQTAWHFCASRLLNQPSGEFEGMINELKVIMMREANPALINIINAAVEHDIDVLSDDDKLSLGHGIGSQTWPITKIPKPEEINWKLLHNIPVSLITGTNGKTTTARLCCAIGSAAGFTSGLTSSEFVRVGDDILDYGDYSGPGGARMLLRDPRLEVAYLEVARGGILRRGLPLRQSRVALVTNVSSDHLGKYGVNTIKDLAETKFAVQRTLAADGILVLNADDNIVVAEAARIKATICWFSLNANSCQIKNAKNQKLTCAWLENYNLMYFDGKRSEIIIDVKDIPLTMAGVARFNIHNALAALCLSRAIGLNNEAIKNGISSFKSNYEDNPGRCNEFSVKGARVFVDFAHNAHSISAVTEAFATIPAKKRFVMIGIGGDRSDHDIREATKSALRLKPDFLVAVEMSQHLRGREFGDVSRIITEQCYSSGLKSQQILSAASPTKGTSLILQQLQPDDFALLLVLSERDQVFKLLEQSAR